MFYNQSLKKIFAMEHINYVRAIKVYGIEAKMDSPSETQPGDLIALSLVELI